MSCEVEKKVGTGDCKLDKNCKSDIHLVDNLASDLVVEILENALEIVEDPEEKTNLGGGIMEVLSCKFQEMKASESLNSSEALTCKRTLKGLGDQLKANEESEVCEEHVKHPQVEKKNRLTDLVKNSKQILSKLILNDSSHRIDINNEKVTRVVDLDSKEDRYKSKRIIDPENVPLPPCDSYEILKKMDHEVNPDESKMEEVELASSNIINDKDEIRAKTMTFPLAGPSGPSSSLLGRYRTLKFTNDFKHKKWNFGTKIINYIKKKGQNRRSDGKEGKPINGIEITPKEDNI